MPNTLSNSCFPLSSLSIRLTGLFIDLVTLDLFEENTQEQNNEIENENRFKKLSKKQFFKRFKEDYFSEEKFGTLENLIESLNQNLNTESVVSQPQSWTNDLQKNLSELDVEKKSTYKLHALITEIINHSYFDFFKQKMSNNTNNTTMPDVKKVEVTEQVTESTQNWVIALRMPLSASYSIPNVLLCNAGAAIPNMFDSKQAAQAVITELILDHPELDSNYSLKLLRIED